MLKPQFVAIIAKNAEGKYLMQMRDSNGTSPLLWCASCGGIEPGESVFDAAVREFEEETGYHFGPVRFALRGVLHRPDRGDVFILRLEEPVSWPLGLYEGAGWGFFTRDEVDGLRMRGCLVRWMWDVLARGWL